MKGFLLGILLVFVSLVQAGDDKVASAEGPRCIGCHSGEVNPALHGIWQGPHRASAGGGDAACTSCHGDSGEHRQRPTEQAPSVSFGPGASSSADVRSAQCMTCHKGGERIMWPTSTHRDEGVACDDCHQSHRAMDPAMAGSDSQMQLCTTCHSQVKSQMKLPSRHPIEEGKTRCSDCHNPHGSTTEASLRGHSPTDSCTSCHSEKRGPFLFEHAPVAEDCSLCHKPHGSVNAALLTNRTPYLCQQCHSAAFHPSVLNDGSGLPSARPNSSLLGKDCLSCHSRIHGTNHPAGGRLTR